MTELLPPDIGMGTAILLALFSFFTSAVSATFGLGGGVAMLVGLLALVPPAVALPLHGVIQIGSNAGRAVMLRAHVMKKIFFWFVPGTLAGVILASLIFTSLPVNALQLLLGGFIIWSVWAPKIRARPIPDAGFVAVGAFGSFTTMFLGATGPFLGAFITPDRYGRDRTVATHATCMTLQHLVKVIAFGFLSFAYTAWLPLLVVMIVAGLMGTWMGKSLLQRLPEAQFKLMFKLCLTALAVKLLFDAVRGFS